jgi:hypothetical protein
MKKLIVEEVNGFRSEVRAAARPNQNRLWVPIRAWCLYTHVPVPCRLSIPSRDDIVASPIREDAPADGATSGYYSGQTPQGNGGRRRPASPIMDDPSAELERELAETHIGRQ